MSNPKLQKQQQGLPSFFKRTMMYHSLPNIKNHLLTHDQKHHMYFGTGGFHNHIAHHLLSLFGVGATTAQIEQAYKDNAHYQNPPKALDERIIQDMSNTENFKKYLGNEEYYHDFLIFFQKEMEAKGWENTLQEYMFSGSELANDIFGRMYDGKISLSQNPYIVNLQMHRVPTPNNPPRLRNRLSTTSHNMRSPSPSLHTQQLDLSIPILHRFRPPILSPKLQVQDYPTATGRYPTRQNPLNRSPLERLQ